MAPTPAQPIEPLASREEEILIPVAQGWTNHEIAEEMHISISTVKTHLASLMRQLNARNRVGERSVLHGNRGAISGAAALSTAAVS